MNEHDTKLMDKIVEKLKTVYDPEIPVDIYELGLIYDVKIDGKKALLDMTLKKWKLKLYGNHLGIKLKCQRLQD